MPSQQRTFESRIDYSLLLPVLLLLSIGVTAIYIAVSHDYPNNVLQIVGQQVVWILLGFLISFIVMFFNTKFLWKMTPFLYLLGLGLMVLPLVFYSESLVASTGAKNWVSIRGVTLFQPSEFMKISYILMLSRVVVKFLQQNKNYERTIALDLFLIVKLALYTLPVLLLLALQSDLGTALVCCNLLRHCSLIWCFVEDYSTGFLDSIPSFYCLYVDLYFKWWPCFSPWFRDADLPDQSDLSLAPSF